MTPSIVNAAPMVIDRGTQDLSTRQVPREQIAIPQHLPKHFFFAQKGTTDPTLVSGNDLNVIYGAKTWNPRGKYFTAATMFTLKSNAEENVFMGERLIPEDAGPKPTIIAWLDVLPTTIDVYQRNPDGSIRINPVTGDPTIVGTTQGYRVKWVITHHADAQAAATFGGLSQKQGNQTDPNTNTQSTMYPIFEFEHSFFGEDGNLSGIRLTAPTIKTVSSMPVKMMNTQFAYPYIIQMIQRADNTSSPTVVKSIFGEQSVMFTFKPEVVDPVTEQYLYAEDIIIQSYENVNDPRYAKVYGNYHRMAVYENNIDSLLTLFHAAEVPYINSYYDFTANPEQRHLFNFVTGVTSQNVPYNTFVLVDASDSTRWSELTNVYSAGGSDGTMNEEVLAELVSARMQAYADPSDPIQDLATNVESVMYDWGAPLATKYEMINFIAVRPDTFIHLVPYDVTDRTLTAAEESSIAIALRTRLQMHPESVYFGTPVMRGAIWGRSAKVRNSQYKKPLPMDYEILRMSANYMGASDGRWKNGSSFEGAPGSIVTDMTDISIPWVPSSVRNRNWDIGLNWVAAYDTTSYFFPAFKTVYNDDTSVLNTYTTAMAIGQIKKVMHAAWREYSGRSDLSGPELCRDVNAFVSARLANRFDGRYLIVPSCQITDMDDLRGFSWTLTVKIGANVAKTVMTSIVQAFRQEDLAGQTTP